MPGVEIDPLVAWGYRDAADAYERARPGYPAEAVAWLAQRLALGAGATVVDLGAGTGKLTRQLLATGARVIAVEPVADMRRVLADAVPEAEVLAGTAEAIPLPAGSVDALTAGQAAHWFRADEAVAELIRVLRPGGGIGFVWNVPDRDDPVHAAIDELVVPHRERGSISKRPDWDAALVRSGFRPLEQWTCPHVHELPAADLPLLAASISFVGALPPAERAGVLERTRSLTRDDRVSLHYRTEVYASRR
jgi:SAM-dependent methyltransferase